MTALIKPKRVLPDGMTSFNTPEGAHLHAKTTQSKWANNAAKEVFKVNSKAFIEIMNDLPDISPLDVMKMAIHTAMAEGNFEAAAKYASMLAEYQTPKLARLESTVTTRVQDLTDDELKKIAEEEGLTSL